MKVFFLPRWFPVPDDPFWGSFVLNHARCLQKVAQVYVLYVDGINDPQRYRKPWFTEIDGVPVCYCFYKRSSVPLIGKLMNTIRMVNAWRRVWMLALKQWGQPDINHVHVLTRMGVMARVIKMTHRIPFVITEHWSRYLPQNFYYTGLLRHLFTRWVVRGAGAVMPVSQHLKQAMESLGLGNPAYTVVPNVVDTHLFQPVVTKPKVKKFSFVHVSTFDNKAKNITGILSAVAKLAAERDDFVLRLIGDGVDFLRIKAHTEKLMSDFPGVVFTGALAPEAVAQEIAEADMLLLFSNYENQPVVILEALACGVPVLATRVGGIPEVINPSNGYLVDPGDEDALLKMMKHVLDLKELPFLAEQIRESAVERFSAERVAQQIADVYLNVIKGSENG